jgi:hypothetical protein
VLTQELGLKGVMGARIEVDGRAADAKLDAQASRRTKVSRVVLDEKRDMQYINVRISPPLDQATTALELYAPATKLQTLEIASTGTQPSLRYAVTSHEGAEYTLAAVFPRGRGQLVILADPEPILNYALAQKSNAPFAVRLFSATGKPVIFDEFYHGMIVRGNPMWLFTRAPYGLITCLVFFATALWVGRRAVHLGPPLAEQQVRRRSILEYVAAMATLFQARPYRNYVIGELWHHTLWMMRRQRRLSARLESPQEIAAAIARNEPGLAKHLNELATTVESRLHGGRRLTSAETTNLAREITKCL